MAVVKSGNSSDLLTVDTTSKAARVTPYNSGGTEVGTVGNPLQVRQRYGRTTRLGTYLASSFRIQGSAGTPQNLVTIQNDSSVATGKYVAILRMTIQNDTTAALATVSPSIKVSRTTDTPSGGAGTLTATKLISSDAAATAVVRVANTSDGGALTAPTATAGNTAWTQFVDRLHTAVGQVLHPDNPILPVPVDEFPLILSPSDGVKEALLIQAVTANATTTHFIINVMWEEYTL
jgi:hypothetical protein